MYLKPRRFSRLMIQCCASGPQPTVMCIERGFSLSGVGTWDKRGERGFVHGARNGKELGIAYSRLLHLWNHFKKGRGFYWLKKNPLFVSRIQIEGIQERKEKRKEKANNGTGLLISIFFLSFPSLLLPSFSTSQHKNPKTIDSKKIFFSPPFREDYRK